MFNNKCFSNLLGVCSVLPALVIMPAVADDILWGDIKSELENGNSLVLTNDVTADAVIDVTGSPTLDLADKTITGWAGQGLHVGNAGSTFTIKGTNAESAVLSGFAYTSQGGLLQSGQNTTINIDNISMNDNGVEGTTTDDYHLGGALKISGIANVTNSIFQGNTARGIVGNSDYEGSAGAIYASKFSKISIKNTKFLQNEADAIGAVGIFKEASLEDVDFEKNKATSATGDGGGALFFGSVSDATVNSVSNSSFKENESASRGGAISTRAFAQGNNSAAKLDITNAVFDSNIAATNGGAIDNYFYHSSTNADGVTIDNSTFIANQANKGGAIYNHIGIDTEVLLDGEKQVGSIYISNSSFMDNIATEKGGAIYNEGNMTLTGNNVFSNNKTNNGLNDIYNIGMLNVSGDLTLDGGIIGDGTIIFAEDSVLNVDLFNGVILQASAITLGNNVMLELDTIENGIEAKDYTFADVTDWTGDFVLKDTLTSNALYTISTAEGVLSITRKSVTDQTANLEKMGLDSNAAKTIAAISGVKTMGNADVDTLFADLTAAAQSGDADAIAQINEVTKAINPESESVVQSVAVSAQNIINNLTVERMDMGRNGGDVDLTSGGVWVQGLYNKSKNADKFSANTRGISAGIDGTINNDIMMGIGYAFGRSDITAQTRNTDIDSHSVFLYGQYKPSEWYANATLNYTMSKYNEEGVAVVPVNSEYRANTFGANVATGYDFASGITPELGLRYMHVRTNAYTNSLGMNVDANSTDFLTGIVGARYGFDIAASDAFLIRPELSAAAKYDMLSDKNVATVALPGVDAYTLDGERLNRFGGEFGAGLKMSYYGFDLSLTYSIDVRKDYTSQTGMAKFRYNF